MQKGKSHSASSHDPNLNRACTDDEGNAPDDDSSDVKKLSFSGSHTSKR